MDDFIIYLDRIKFYYNARASLLEAKHWLWLLKVRGKITESEFKTIFANLEEFHHQLNKFIKSTYSKKYQN